jgi:GDPmannose 4,6-dehydratase
MAKRALITGITGQDGSYLAEFLLDQGYEVCGMVRRSSTLNFERIAHIQDRLTLVAGDLLDEVSMINILRDNQPTEVYNLAAQSFVQTSWNQPVLTGETTALGVTRVLDAIRIVNPEIRFYQASSSEMFGKVLEVPLRGGQGLRPLDHRQLPGKLRPARQLGHPVQPRVPPPRPRVRDPQGDPRGGPHRRRHR